MSETPERVFTIEGADYPIPQLTSLTLDEAVVFYRVAGFPVEDLWIKPKDTTGIQQMLDRMRDPAVVLTLVNIAYRRGNPGVPDRDVADVVGRVQLLDALSALMAAGEGRDVPLAETPEPDGSSKRRTNGASKRSGRASTKSSGAPADRLAPTGT